MRILMLGNSLTSAQDMPDILAELTGAEVVCHTRGGARLSAKGWDYGGMARNLSAAYRRAAEENRALLADVGRRFYQLPGTQDLYAADGVHPSGQGARIAAETIAAAIQRHKEDPS